MRNLITSIESEYQRYKALAENAMQQLEEEQLGRATPPAGNSIATIVWHISGNLESRFTDFLTSDGEKPWRQREEEFATRTVMRDELMVKWQRGWAVLEETLTGLTDDHLLQEVTIRGRGLAVHEALHRSLAHVAYHVGQIVHISKTLRGAHWRYLSIPPGGSAAYNQDPALDRPREQATALGERTDTK